MQTKNYRDWKTCYVARLKNYCETRNILNTNADANAWSTRSRSVVLGNFCTQKGDSYPFLFRYLTINMKKVKISLIWWAINCCSAIKAVDLNIRMHFEMQQQLKTFASMYLSRVCFLAYNYNNELREPCLRTICYSKEHKLFNILAERKGVRSLVQDNTLTLRGLCIKGHHHFRSHSPTACQCRHAVLWFMACNQTATS